MTDVYRRMAPLPFTVVSSDDLTELRQYQDHWTRVASTSRLNWLGGVNDQSIDQEDEIRYADSMCGDGLPYVREVGEWFSSRKSRPPLMTIDYGLLVAWAVLRGNADGDGYGRFLRRVWRMRSYDPRLKTPGAPLEAVDPTSIQAGQRSVTVVDWGRGDYGERVEEKGRWLRWD